MKRLEFYEKQLKLLFVILITVISGYLASGQEPPHPPESGHGSAGNYTPGGTARITDGIGILIAFALAYSYRRISVLRKKGDNDSISGI